MDHRDVNPPAEQLIRDYLNRLSLAARGKLDAAGRQSLLDHTRARIEAECGGTSPATSTEVRKALAGLGDPMAIVELERAKFSAGQAREGGGATAMQAESDWGNGRAINGSAINGSEVGGSEVGGTDGRPGPAGSQAVSWTPSDVGPSSAADAPFAIDLPLAPDSPATADRGQVSSVTPVVEAPPPAQAFAAERSSDAASLPVENSDSQAGSAAAETPGWAKRVPAPREAPESGSASQPAPGAPSPDDAEAASQGQSGPADSETASDGSDRTAQVGEAAAGRAPEGPRFPGGRAASTAPVTSGHVTARDAESTLSRARSASAISSGLRPGGTGTRKSGSGPGPTGPAPTGSAPTGSAPLGSGGAARFVAGATDIVRSHTVEFIAVLLLGVGGAVYPPIWLAGVALALPSRKWDIRDKFLGITLPVFLVIIGTVLILVLGGQHSTLESYAREAWLGAERLSRALAVIGGAYLLWGLRRGRRAPRQPPWNVPHKLG
ncbi:MAG TPA: hypothetical protein VFQ44_21360 [Streptosporangiaceae bacterium]|nr:hypothetical protein [Streptosporangiaceae bacterium]